MSKYLRFLALCHSAAAVQIVVLALAAWSPATVARAEEIKRPADAIEVFHCAFDAAWDANYDEWPDRWTRKSGEAYPHYVHINMRETDDPQATGGRWLQLELDGASAAISSPPIRVTSRFSYLLTTRLYVSSLKYSDVTVSIDFYNSAGKRLQTRKQALASRRDGWHTITIESIDPGDESIDRAVIGLETRRGPLEACVMERSPPMATELAPLVLYEFVTVTLPLTVTFSAEKTVALRFKCAVIDRFRLFDFAVRPRQDVVGRRDRNLDLVERRDRRLRLEDIGDLVHRLSPRGTGGGRPKSLNLVFNLRRWPLPANGKRLNDATTRQRAAAELAARLQAARLQGEPPRY